MHRNEKIPENEFQGVTSSAGLFAYFTRVFESNLLEQIAQSVSSLPHLLHSFSVNHIPNLLLSSLAMHYSKSSVNEVCRVLQLLFELYRPILILTTNHLDVLNYLQQRKMETNSQMIVGY